MARWDLAAVVVAIIAIPAAMSPVALRFISKLFRALVAKMWPACGQCERLEWVDIPDGTLHQCSIPVQNCQHLGVLGRKRSWDISIGAIFTRIKRGNFVRKPAQLDLSTTYVRTDTKTLKALLVLTNARRLGRGENIKVTFKQVGVIMTAYLDLPLQPPNYDKGSYYRMSVTKKEMDCLFEGYPPWYQEPLLLANGNSIPYPVEDLDDAQRGGWIAAVGLSPTLPQPYQLIASEAKGSSWRRKHITLRKAFNRVLRGLEKIANVFPDEELVAAARRIIENTSQGLLEHHDTTSALLYPFLFGNPNPFDKVYGGHGWVQMTNLDFARTLTDEQCKLAIQVFNHYNDLSDLETEQLKPIWRTVLRVILVGSYRVMDYFSECDGGRYFENTMALEAPELGQNRTVYLRDRQEEDEN
jgi:hypothetical protein